MPRDFQTKPINRTHSMTDRHPGIFDPRRACRRAARSHHRRAGDADLSDHVLRVQRRRPRRLAVRPAGVRQHLYPHRQSRPTRCWKSASRRSKAAPRRSPSPRATPRRSWCCSNCCMPGDEFIAARKLYGGSINQFTHAFKSFGWNVVWADPDDVAQLRARGDAAHQGDLHRVDRQSRPAASPTSRRSRRWPARPACR